LRHTNDEVRLHVTGQAAVTSSRSLVLNEATAAHDIQRHVDEIWRYFGDSRHALYHRCVNGWIRYERSRVFYLQLS
jgi:hypothetical protein